MENLAVIDLGSNSVRMTISRISSDGTYETVAEENSTSAYRKIWVLKNFAARGDWTNDNGFKVL